MDTNLRPRSDAFIGAHVPAALAAAIQKQAREDGRTVSAYVRRVLAAAVPQQVAADRDRDRG
jgi:anti-sigma factor RsiW